MTESVGVDLDRGAGALAVLPVADAEPARDDDAVTLVDGADRVDGELAEAGDRVPVGVGIDPLGLRAVVAALGRGEPERGDRQTRNDF